MDTTVLTRATLGGAIAQIVMVVAGHFVPSLRDPGFAIGGMAISLIAGLYYGRAAAGRWAGTLGSGAIAGGVSALIGIAVSVALGDVPAGLLLMGSAASALAGLAGSAIGRAFARR